MGIKSYSCFKSKQKKTRELTQWQGFEMRQHSSKSQPPIKPRKTIVCIRAFQKFDSQKERVEDKVSSLSQLLSYDIQFDKVQKRVANFNQKTLKDFLFRIKTASNFQKGSQVEIPKKRSSLSCKVAERD